MISRHRFLTNHQLPLQKLPGEAIGKADLGTINETLVVCSMSKRISFFLVKICMLSGTLTYLQLDQLAQSFHNHLRSNQTCVHLYIQNTHYVYMHT